MWGRIRVLGLGSLRYNLFSFFGGGIPDKLQSSDARNVRFCEWRSVNEYVSLYGIDVASVSSRSLAKGMGVELLRFFNHSMKF